MSDSLSTIGSIAYVITSSITNIPTGVSGNMLQFVDVARQYASQFTGVSIGSNSIPENYQMAIFNLSMSNAINTIVSQGYGTIAELTINGGNIPMSAQAYKDLGEMQLKVLGRHVSAVRSLS